MQQYFQKFDFELKPFEYEQLKGPLVFQYGYPDVIIFLHQINNIELFKSLHYNPISSIPPNRVFYSEIVGRGYLQPHTDLGVGCNLNWYFQTDDSSTVFFDETAETQHLSNIKEQGENVFHLDQLTERCRFSAEKNTAYLLNVSKPHSVHKPKLKIRKFFSYQWLNHDYQTVLDSLLIKKADC
jgi:hypothetical protein